jgi:hypothetical protein
LTRLSLFRDENAVNVEIGYILNLLVLMIFTGSIVAAFQLYADSSSQKSMRAGFADLGSQIARDITNMYLASAHSQNNFSFNVTRDIPLTIGGSGYSIKLNNASEHNQFCFENTGRNCSVASIDIKEERFFGYTASTTLNSIDFSINASGTVYSGSGTMNIWMQRNNSGTWIWIK